MKKTDDSPYAESPARPTKPAAKHPARPAAKHPVKHAAKHPAKHPVKHAAKHPAAHDTDVPPAKRSRRGRSRKKAGTATPAAHPRKRAGHELTSHPTSRNAMVDTRAWLLKQYGPHCAYCGEKFSPRVMTLDHVAPRRGQTAYDRRDNLVLACGPCNALKRDKAPLAFLLAVKSRAANLLKYGKHLSHGLIELARPLVREPEPPQRVRYNAAYEDDGPSPYRS